MRAALPLVLAISLQPEVLELVETIAHRVTTGHFAHSADDDQPLGTAEHGCSATQHHCTCCTSQPMLARGQALPRDTATQPGGWVSGLIGRALDRASGRAFRPPIA